MRCSRYDSMPTPLSWMLSVGLIVALEVICREALRAPVTVGANVTLIVQLLLGARVGERELHVPGETLNWPASAPVRLMGLTNKCTAPVFRMVKVCVLGKEMPTFPKSCIDGVTVMVRVGSRRPKLHLTVDRSGTPEALNTPVMVAK